METKAEEKIRILYVDDEENNLHAFKATFKRDFTFFFLAKSAKEGMEILNNEEVNIVITDQRMPEKTGVEFLESIIETHSKRKRTFDRNFTKSQSALGVFTPSKSTFLISTWLQEEAGVLYG